ncbi:hypothetical protein M514_25825 [Trichuris suis]|uniref:Uncharacterized protein n=1 Tax=Trichuris suis TaxID=68888 RepID=A0A085MXR9_9BILA|nr:hypothetical protein M514_25825 [Trichuris suis]
MDHEITVLMVRSPLQALKPIIWNRHLNGHGQTTHAILRGRWRNPGGIVAKKIEKLCCAVAEDSGRLKAAMAQCARITPFQMHSDQFVAF